MKIHRIDIEVCDRFPNKLSLDFTNQEGEPYPEIVIAGENGIGKTAILTLISQALRWNELGQTEKDNRNFLAAKYKLTVSFSEKEVGTFLSSKSTLLETLFKDRGINEKELYLLQIDTYSEPADRVSLFYALDSQGNVLMSRHHNIHGVNDRTWLSYVRPLYLPPEIQFTGERILDTKNSIMDNKEGATKFNATQTQLIKQMIVDVSIGDEASITAELKEKRNDLSSDEFIKRFDILNENSRVSRFTNAFNNFFENIKFMGVSNKHPSYPGEYMILFRKNSGATFDIENLSSGEKQIVYRGAFLMKDAGVERTAIALIDEPEISLHPAWQRKIMEYYSKIVHVAENSDNQLFATTHSPYVIQGAQNACFYILETVDNKVIAIKNEKFDNWTPNQLSVEAFNLKNLHHGEVNKKLNKLRQMISEIERGNGDATSEEYVLLEKEIRELVRSDDAILLSADLLDLRHKIISLKD